MKTPIVALLAAICSCNDSTKHSSHTNEMSFPSQHPLDCSPFGIRDISFDLLEDEDDDDDALVLSLAEAETAMNLVLVNWSNVWSEVHPRIEELLLDYEYGKTVADLLSEPKNTISVTIIPPDEDEKFRLDVAIDVTFEHGSHVFGVEFEELKPVDATATF